MLILSLDGWKFTYILHLFWWGMVASGPNNKQSGYRQIALATTIPLIMLAAPAVGYFIGKLLDRWIGTTIVMTVIFLLLGVAAGGVEAYRLIKEVSEEDKKEDS